MGKVRAILKARVIGEGGMVVRTFCVLGQNLAELGGPVEILPRRVGPAAGEGGGAGGRPRRRPP